MARVRVRDTGPELKLRSMLHRLGYRFTVNAPNNRNLPAKPDVVLPMFRTVILVHGCFWHGHEGCEDFRMPATRREWWESKIDANRARDARQEEALCDLGWNVITVWECALKSVSARKWLERRLPRLLGSSCGER